MDYDATVTRLEEIARDRASAHAQSWVSEALQGPDRAAEILAMVESDDAADLPSPDLSGELADEPTARDVLADVDYDGDAADETATELLDAYESEYASHGESEVIRILTGHADEDTLQRMTETSVSDLVTLGDLSYGPDVYGDALDASDGSAGSRVLALARDATVGALRERMKIYDTETLAEAVDAMRDDLSGQVADECVDDGHGVWTQFVDLGAWVEDVQGLYDPAASNALEHGARAAVIEILRRTVAGLLDDMQ